MANSRASVVDFLKREFRLRTVLLYAIVFLTCFDTAKFGQYLFYTLHTSPALIWPPFGIALGVILVGGYRMWLPIALAELLAVYSAGMSPLPVILAAVVGQTLQALIGAWVLRKLDFDNNLSSIVDAFFLIGIAIVASMISPTFSGLAQLATHTLNASISISWVRNWAGGMLSILILTPLVTTWLPPRKFFMTRIQAVETVVALFLITAVTIALAWTQIAAPYGLTGIYVELALLTWISIRMEPRILTFALFILAAFGMGGSFFLHTATPLNETLFSQELIIEFFAVIFLTFSALIEERRRARIALEKNVVELERALERIESEDVAKNQFIATLAHELRNPLAPVVSALDLLSLQDPSPDAAQTIEGAQRELNVMRRLLDDILDVARVSQTKFKMQMETIDIRPLLERCVESTRYFLRNRKHTLTISLPEDPVIVEVDPVRFEQIVVNLLNNAGKYTPSGGRIQLACEKTSTHAIVRVSDNGIGIPQDSLTDVFEPFRQIRATPQIGTGLGIGLWLTKRLVEMHAGTIEARSDGLERGSSFMIYLPLRDGYSPTTSKAKISTPILPSFKILIADDNEAAAQAMQKLLKLKGNDVRVAYTATSALEVAAEFPAQVMLLDIGLPDMNGYDLARELRRRASAATLIALTGYGQEEDKKNAMEAGFDYHLTKPVGIADIEQVLGSLSR